MVHKNDINSLLRLLINEVATQVSERLISTVEEHLENKLANAPKSQKLLLDTDELASLLSLSKSTIIKLRKQGLPIVRIGDSVRFEPKEVMHFIINPKI
jgi:excisionase family DNA binding protein